MDKMDFKRMYDGALIVAPRAEWGRYYAYRREYPAQDFSLIDREGFAELFLYQNDDRALAYLLEKHAREQGGVIGDASLDVAEEELSAICLLPDPGKEKPGYTEKLKRLCALRDELLSQNLIWRTPYLQRGLERNIYISRAYASWHRAASALDKLPGFHSVAPDAIYEEERADFPEVHVYPTATAELHAAFNYAAHLLQKGVDIDDIYFAGLDESYALLIPDFEHAYGFRVEPFAAKRLFDLPLSQAFLGAFNVAGVSWEDAVHAFQEAHGEEANASAILEMAYAYRIPSLPLREQKKLYASFLKGMKEQLPHPRKVVHVLSSFFAPYSPNASHVILLNFSEGQAPRRHRDDAYLSDEEKKLIGQFASIDDAKEEEQDLSSFLKSPSLDYVSFKKNGPTGECFVSPFLLTKGMKEASSPLESEAFEYSHEAAALLYASLKDEEAELLHRDPRLDAYEPLHLDEGAPWTKGGFPHAFRSFPGASEEWGKTLSYSALECFDECPFHYYLTYILRLPDEGDDFAARLGSLCHAYLQRRFANPSESSDEAYEIAYEAMNEGKDAKTGQSDPSAKPFTDKENVLLWRARNYITQIASFDADGEKSAASPRSETEVSLSASGENYRCKGYIDRVLEVGDDHAYYCLIDYKSGPMAFDPRLASYGLGMQLPVYAYLSSHSASFAGKKLLGLFIQPVRVSPGDNKVSAKNRLSGAFSLDSVALERLQSSITTPWALGKSPYIRGLCYSKKDGYYAGQGANGLTEADFASLSEDAEKALTEAARRIEEGDFPINPVETNGFKAGADVNACKNCPYADICRVKYEDKRRIYLTAEDAEDEEEGEDEQDE